MSRWGKAIFAGIAIEGILFAVSFLIWGGWGPSGPISPIGQVIIWFHYPAILATVVFTPPEWLVIPFFLSLSAAQWSLIVYAIQRWKLRR